MLGRITAGLFFLLLIWGNLVAGMHAGVHSGMACPDWPLCQGKVLPPAHVDVWMEFMHRMIAGVATISLLLVARKRLKVYKGMKKAVPIVSIGLICVEIVLGALVVLLGLPVQLTTVHFMVALAVFLLVLYMTASDGEKVTGLLSFGGYALPLFFLLLLVFSQASLGAYLRHSAAALACPGFPVCRGELFPDLMDPATTANLSHRLLGLGIFGSAVMLYLASTLDIRLKGRHRQLLTLSLLVVAQIAVGVAVVKTRLSSPITSVHLALTLAIIGLSLRLWLLQTGQLGVKK